MMETASLADHVKNLHSRISVALNDNCSGIDDVHTDLCALGEPMADVAKELGKVMTNPSFDPEGLGRILHYLGEIEKDLRDLVAREIAEKARFEEGAARPAAT